RKGRQGFRKGRQDLFSTHPKRTLRLDHFEATVRQFHDSTVRQFSPRLTVHSPQPICVCTLLLFLCSKLDTSFLLLHTSNWLLVNGLRTLANLLFLFDPLHRSPRFSQGPPGSFLYAS